MNKILCILILFLPATVYAEIYKTVDENGRVIFTDKPAAKAVQIEVNVNSVEGPATVSTNSSTSYSGGKVVMFSTSWCKRPCLPVGSVSVYCYGYYIIRRSDESHKRTKK